MSTLLATRPRVTSWPTSPSITLSRLLTPRGAPPANEVDLAGTITPTASLTGSLSVAGPVYVPLAWLPQTAPTAERLNHLERGLEWVSRGAFVAMPWEDRKTPITAERLNRLEQGIAALDPSYIAFAWANGRQGGTPITVASFQRLEDGLAAACSPGIYPGDDLYPGDDVFPWGTL